MSGRGALRAAYMLVAIPLHEGADSLSIGELAEAVKVQLQAIFSVVRKNGFFQMNTLLLHRKVGASPWPVPDPTWLIPAVHPGNGVGVFLDFKFPTKLDRDVKRVVWAPKAWQLEAALETIRWSQKATHDLLGRPFGGEMPYAELADFM